MRSRTSSRKSWCCRSATRRSSQNTTGPSSKWVVISPLKPHPRPILPPTLHPTGRYEWFKSKHTHTRIHAFAVSGGAETFYSVYRICGTDDDAGHKHTFLSSVVFRRACTLAVLYICVIINEPGHARAPAGPQFVRCDGTPARNGVNEYIANARGRICHSLYCLAGLWYCVHTRTCLALEWITHPPRLVVCARQTHSHHRVSSSHITLGLNGYI